MWERFPVECHEFSDETSWSTKINTIGGMKLCMHQSYLALICHTQLQCCYCRDGDSF